MQNGPFLSDSDDPFSDWEPAHDPGPAPDLSHLSLHEPLEAEWLLSDHPWAQAERARRRGEERQAAVAHAEQVGLPEWAIRAEVDAAEPDAVYRSRMRRSLEALHQADDPMYVYPPGLIGPMASMWPPPGHPAHVPGLEAGGWNNDL
ncbi:hypothetical protein [Streptomyces sp. NPDC037389]|uniref:hypothetical protein n=1 Tax=Streptomyces sp. NPDC037389 TaxID=3155369 RepID=UPI0033DC20CA